MRQQTDPSTQEPDRSRRAIARQVEVADWKWLLSSKQGRRIAWRLLDRAGVFRTSFTGNSETFFNEGRRDMGLFILGEIQAHSPDAFALMLTESREPA
jgi:hypothetical protein